MHLQLRPATAADIPNIVTIGLSAFHTNPIHERVFPRDLPASDAFWASTFADEIDDPNAHFLIVEDVTSTTTPSQQPIFVGFAKWNLVSADSHPPPPPGTHIWPADAALADHFFGTLVERHTAIMGARRHWYLELIGTQVAYHGQGAGAMMVGWGVERADADGDGVEAYLDSTPAGRRLYEKLGLTSPSRRI
ncbi:acyl-CoA N-acyltransferase [Podospora appendiculata]|uniref:Acyl-CoA N-acyltransferase n=1 Tax=Podospora appendiculata TaxID=314037 RepID=A0AAE0X520_9PEZI|nr:acyl-CoA N-acyltransferase [Podospora appendiculata]